MPNKQFEDFTILYAEDDEGVRTITLSILKRMFKKTYAAKDGNEAFALYKEKKPDILLLDIRMPGLSGLELSKKIRENDESTKIIITTAFSDQHYLLEAVELNLIRYIVKPLTKRNLIPALEKAISKIEVEQKLFITENFYYNYKTKLFYRDNQIIDTTKRELDFLTLLVKHCDRVVTYSEIENYVWNGEYMSVNSLRTMVGFLRKKIPDKTISNISNLGYRLKIGKN